MPYTPAPLWKGPAIRGRYWGLGRRRGLGDDTITNPYAALIGGGSDSGNVTLDNPYASFVSAVSAATPANSSTSPLSSGSLLMWGVIAIGAAMFVSAIGGRR